MAWYTFLENNGYSDVSINKSSDVKQTEAVFNLTKSPEFIIPELPSGRRLEIDITSTWGDRHYLGLNGIELFSISGELVQVAQVSTISDKNIDYILVHNL